MFDLDLTAWTLITATVFTGVYLLIRRRKDGPFEHSGAYHGGMTVFLSALAVPASLQLIAAAIKGRTDELPEGWRTYVGLVGVIAFYFVADKLWNTFRSLFEKKSEPVASLTASAAQLSVADAKEPQRAQS